MKRVLELLEERNRCLEKFDQLNVSHIKAFQDGNFDKIDEFYSHREGLLEMIQKVEELVQGDLREPQHAQAEQDEKAHLQLLLYKKEALVKTILHHDLEIIELIEQEKSKVIRDLLKLQKNRKNISAYHSGRSEQLLDEEV